MRRSLTNFQELPDDCTCNGEGLAPVGSVPRIGGLPELVTYECPVCGHVETIEKHPDHTQHGQELEPSYLCRIRSLDFNSTWQKGRGWAPGYIIACKNPLTHWRRGLLNWLRG